MKPLLGCLLVGSLWAQQPSLNFFSHDRPLVDAHNCYPYEGRWGDRIDRALSTPLPVSIEQDLAWFVDPATGTGRMVIVHEPSKMTGLEPSLRDHFFERIRPMVESAISKPEPSRWPLIILHLDFKTNEPALLQAVWRLLGDYEEWIVTAPKHSASQELSTLSRKPILVLTEDSDAQEEVFYKRVPQEAKLRVFGSAHLPILPGSTEEERAHFAATLPPEKLLTERPTNYRRWWNNSWRMIEEGGQAHAGDWTPAEESRLKAFVSHARRMGFWIRFYALDGFAPTDSRGWDENYNFGSLAAVLTRWKAAIAAGVNLIATDQYEELASLLSSRPVSLK